jgi:YbgC/YbaW family acyl-CoA thioester hydrolase
MGAFTFRRPVRFDEVDGAGYIFFPNYAVMAHEALERIFEAAEPGSYARFIQSGIGLPAVHLGIDFKSPLRFGDTLQVDARIVKFGRTSVTFALTVTKHDGTLCAALEYVVVCSELAVARAVPLPAAIKTILEPYAA